MRSALNDDGMDRVERLVAELRAIERLNVDYWRKDGPETYEMLGLLARRERRAEILSQLLTLTPRLTEGMGRPWVSRKSNQRAKGKAGVSVGFSGNLK